MTNPFLIKGPAAISFSGGRTSAFMLRKILDAHNGKLPDDVHVLFSNTGKEREETLDFVRECGERWGVRVRWLEYAPAFGGTRVDFHEVAFESAARNGEPFAAMMDHERFVPNPTKRLCTKNCKVLVMQAAMAAGGLAPGQYAEVIGFRLDEAHRVARLRAEWPKRVLRFPLVAANIAKHDVLAFWRTHPFDLALGPNESNCDLCFLKGHATRVAIMQARPEAAAWWIEQERLRGYPFRKDGPSYAALAAFARDQMRLPIVDDDPTDLGGCACHD